MEKKAKHLIVYDEQGKKIGVIFKKAEFNDLMESLDDLRDARIAYQDMSKKTKDIPFEQLKKELLGNDIRK